MTKRAKPGRPPKYVKDANGRPVVGLSYDSSNNYYFNTHWKTDNHPKQNFGTDKLEAIAKFHIWQSQQKGILTTIENVNHSDLQSEITIEKQYTPEELEVMNEIRRDAGEPELPKGAKIYTTIDPEAVEAYEKDKRFEIKHNLTFFEGIF